MTPVAFDGAGVRLRVLQGGRRSCMPVAGGAGDHGATACKRCNLGQRVKMAYCKGFYEYGTKTLRKSYCFEQTGTAKQACCDNGDVLHNDVRYSGTHTLSNRGGTSSVTSLAPSAPLTGGKLFSQSHGSSDRFMHDVGSRSPSMQGASDQNAKLNERRCCPTAARS